MHHHPWPMLQLPNRQAKFSQAQFWPLTKYDFSGTTRMKSFLISSVIMRDDSGAFASLDGKQGFGLELSANFLEAQQRGTRKRISYSLHDVVGAAVVDDPKLGAGAAVLKLHAYPASSSKSGVMRKRRAKHISWTVASRSLADTWAAAINQQVFSKCSSASRAPLLSPTANSKVHSNFLQSSCSITDTCHQCKHYPAQPDSSTVAVSSLCKAVTASTMPFASDCQPSQRRWKCCQDMAQDTTTTAGASTHYICCSHHSTT
eukprot:12349-Heterococcus_DN1.PRE.4